MLGEKPSTTNNSSTPGTSPASAPSAPAGTSAEKKRQAARRRFLAKGTAAGSGLLIVTLYHQRGLAKDKDKDKGKKLVVSSPERCMSLGGTPGKKSEFKDSVTGHKIKGIECDNMPPG